MELPGRADAAAPGQVSVLLDFGGAFFSSFLNKALKWKWIRCFYYCINIHFNSLQKLTHFSS